MKPIISRSVLLGFIITFSLKATAQLCTGGLGDPVVNETFGSCTTPLTGCIVHPLPAGITTLAYTSNPCNDNNASYGFVSYMYGCHAATWHIIWQDHTGDPNGYFFLANGPTTAAQVYELKVDGSKLCPNTTYEFAAWLMNVLVLTDSTKDWVEPNFTFSIETAGGKVLKTINTGDMPETVQPQWVQYGASFTSPSDGSDIIITLVDNQTLEGNGNDFALDDITVRPCGAVIEAAFDSVSFNVNANVTSKQMCQDSDATYILKGTEIGYDNPSYQWQQNLNDGNGWTNISGATDTALNLALNTPPPGADQYRMGVLSSNSTSLACRIYSQPVTVNVNPLPVSNLPAITTVCAGQPLQLTVNQADTYVWTGPNGFFSSTNSTSNYVIITDSASTHYNGTYSVMVTKAGCPFFESTNVVVYPLLTNATVNNATICEGETAALTVECPGATTFSWTPSAGLSATDKGTVNANPVQTTNYTVTIGNGGCNAITRLVTVTVLKKPIANAGSNKKIMEGQSVKLNGVIKGDSVNYYWTPANYLDNAQSLTPIASPTDNITYTLHAISADNCGEDTSSVFVRVYKKITISNTFTPNNDGINDLWDIKQLITYPESSLMVFNRYGQQVYQSNGYPKPWDGTYNGSPLPQGTYYYIIDLKNDTPKIAGWVLIVR